MPGPRKKSPLKRATRSRTAPASPIWGDSIRAVRIASGIHETGARSSRSFKPLKPRTAPMRRSPPRTRNSR